MLSSALATYNGLRGAAPMPAYRDLRPERFGAALAHIALVECLADGAKRFRIRLAGTEIENRKFGYVGGAFVEDVEPAHYRDHLVAAYGHACRANAPTFERVVSQYSFGNFVYMRLILPLSGRGNGAGFLLVATERTSELKKLMLRVHDSGSA
jgi:hypothetical protein